MVGRKFAGGALVRLVIILYATCAYFAAGVRAEANDQVQVEVERLRVLLHAETDPHQQEIISQQIDDAYLREPRRETNALRAAWQAETDPVAKKELGKQLSEAAVHSEQPEIVTEVATDGSFAEKRIDISQPAQPMLLRECLSLPAESGDAVAQSGICCQRWPG
jgi:hypothetical protein